MRTPRSSPRVALAVPVALLAALLIAACGGSSKPSGSSAKNASATTTTKSATASRAALVTCLKQQGVTLPSDRGGRRGFGGFRHGTTTTGAPPTGTRPSGGFPGGAGGGFFGGGGSGFAGANSKFAKAFKACDKKLGIRPGAGFGPGARRFGNGAGGGFTPHFSTATLKSYVSCIRKNGYPEMPEPKNLGKGQFFPKSVGTNAKFQAANKNCESILFKAFRRPAAGAGPSAGTQTITGSSTLSST